MRKQYNVTVPAELIKQEGGKTSLERATCFTVITGILIEVCVSLSL